MLSLDDAVSPINTTGHVVFFPTCGHFDPSREEWVLPIHGWVFDPTRPSKMSRATLAIFQRYLRFKTKQELNTLFLDRADGFLVGNQRGMSIPIRVGDRVEVLAKSQATGHFHGAIHAHVEDLTGLTSAAGASWLSFEALTAPDDPRKFTGKVQLLPPTGLSIISDIDDTIKHSEVRNRRELLANTFLRDFQPIPWVADVYRQWAAAGACFHYVSSSPWQLYRPLSTFLGEEGFPEGTFHLRFLRIRDSRLFRLFITRPAGKIRAIESMLNRFPQRRFWLVGDSGERDPEIYGTIAAKYPFQVERILIRDVTGHGNRRYAQAFSGVAADKWTLFRDRQELVDAALSHIDRNGALTADRLFQPTDTIPTHLGNAHIVPPPLPPEILSPGMTPPDIIPVNGTVPVNGKVAPNGPLPGINSANSSQPLRKSDFLQ